MICLNSCRKTTIGFVVLILALAAGIAIGLSHRPATMTSPDPGTIPAQAITALFATKLPDKQGTARRIGEWEGKTLVVNFWAAWCQPCREEMPAFSRLQEKHAGNNVQFVGIAVDNLKNVAEFSEKVTVGYPLLIAETDGGELMRQLGNTSMGLPYTLVIAPTGKASLAHLGKLPETRLDGLLQEIAKGSGPAHSGQRPAN